MKRLFYIFVAMVLFLATGCQEKLGQSFPFEGDWHYNYNAEENGVAEDVWVSFAADGTFEMYQKIGEGAYWFSHGKFTYDSESKVLSGVYSDRYPWKYTYGISVSGDSLVMTPVELEDYSVTYTRGTIPSEVREKSLPLTKAETVERYL